MKLDKEKNSVKKNAKKTPSLEQRDEKKKVTKGTFADRLSDLLDKSSSSFKMTGKELADKANISVGIISGYRQNINTPAIDKLIRIADALDVTTDYLLGKAENKTADNEAIRKEIGLTDVAIENIRKIKNIPEALDSLNDFIAHNNFLSLIRAITECKETLSSYLGSAHVHKDVIVSDVEKMTALCIKLGYVPQVPYKAIHGEGININKYFSMIIEDISKSKQILKDGSQMIRENIEEFGKVESDDEYYKGIRW